MQQLVIFAFLLGLGLFIGTYLENRHYKSIQKRENESYKRVCLSDKKCPKDIDASDSKLASGSIVVSIDHFKKLMFGIRNLFGGEVKSYSSLLDRARREAILRMKESEPTADLFLNVRLETFSISKGVQGQISSVEMFAYGTAVWLNK